MWLLCVFFFFFFFVSNLLFFILFFLLSFFWFDKTFLDLSLNILIAHTDPFQCTLNQFVIISFQNDMFVLNVQTFNSMFVLRITCAWSLKIWKRSVWIIVHQIRILCSKEIFCAKVFIFPENLVNIQFELMILVVRDLITHHRCILLHKC